jgi:hypothetical protein
MVTVKNPDQASEQKSIGITRSVELMTQMHQLRQGAASVEQQFDFRWHEREILWSGVRSPEIVQALECLVHVWRLDFGTRQKNCQRARIRANSESLGQ